MHSLALALFWGALAHMVGDYVLQSNWMAQRKTKEWGPALWHGATYGLPFMVVLGVFAHRSGWLGALAYLLIVGTHIPIDHYRLVTRLIWLKNQFGPEGWQHPWDAHVAATGYHVERHGWHDKNCSAQATPIWMAVWLMIAADNTIHIIINSLAITLAVGGR